MESPAPTTRPMTETEKLAYKKGLDKGFERGKVYAPAPPTARRSWLVPVLLILLLILGGVAGWAVAGLVERDRRLAALAAEMGRFKTDGDDLRSQVEAAGVVANRLQADVTRAEADRIRAEQQVAVREREAAARRFSQPMQPRPEPPRKKSVSEMVEEKIQRPAGYKAVQLIPEEMAVGTSGVLYNLTVDRILDENAAVLRDNLRRRVLVINFPTKGLVDDKPIAPDASRGAEATAVRVIGRFVVAGRTLFVIERE